MERTGRLFPVPEFRSLLAPLPFGLVGGIWLGSIPSPTRRRRTLTMRVSLAPLPSLPSPRPDHKGMDITQVVSLMMGSAAPQMSVMRCSCSEIRGEAAVAIGPSGEAVEWRIRSLIATTAPTVSGKMAQSRTRCRPSEDSLSDR